MQSGRDVARGFISSLIWTAYMVNSQRVAATFVRDVATPAQLDVHVPVRENVSV